ncbi:uncharacterized protein ACNLHF_011417 [Anomaloglossus baeobatrachus]|uniref:uncharacterized protein LOC142292416 n=1 Tax=Anomaloglossus baeobatrachus TaxID=238106 RepID=UPI003F5036FF
MSQSHFTTFSYNEEETNNIVSKITSSSNFLSIPSEDIRKRDLEKELRRHTSLELHAITLAEYHRTKRIPRGLRVALRPTLFSENIEFCDRFEAIINKCSMDIIVLTIDFLQKEISLVSNNIRAADEQLKQTLSASDLAQLKKKTDDIIGEFRRDLEARKRSKFLRDQEDYTRGTVYRWRAGESFNTRRPQGYGGYSSSDTSDTDSRPQRQPPTFLGQRRLPPRRRQGGGGDPNRYQRGERVWTRSQNY